MTTRVKTVFPNTEMVAHVWAQRSQVSGRTRTRNVSFEGDRFYSYRAEIARFVEARDGQAVVLVSTRKWSVTTSGHQALVRGATRQYTQFNVPSLDGDHHTNLVDLKKRYDAEIARLKRARERPTRDFEWHYLTQLATQLHDYQVVFGVAIVVPDWDDVRAEIERHWDAKEARLSDPKTVARRERERERRAEREAELERLRRADVEAQIEGWKAGMDVRLPWTGEVYLRVRGERLETSQGAQVPLRDAIRVFRIVKRVRDGLPVPTTDLGQDVVPKRGVTYVDIGVGHFRVSQIESDGSFRAGCHFITWPEIERVAREIGVFEEELEVA